MRKNSLLWNIDYPPGVLCELTIHLLRGKSQNKIKAAVLPICSLYDATLFSTWVKISFPGMWKGEHTSQLRENCTCFDINYNTKTTSGQVFNIQFSDLVVCFLRFFTHFLQVVKVENFSMAKIKYYSLSNDEHGLQKLNKSIFLTDKIEAENI